MAIWAVNLFRSACCSSIMFSGTILQDISACSTSCLYMSGISVTQTLVAVSGSEGSKKVDAMAEGVGGGVKWE